MEIEIKRLGINGEGVGDVDSKVCFVEGGVPGDVVDATISESKSRFLRAKINSIVKASPDRINPQCPYFDKCGGCDIQHISSSMQLQFKSQKVADSLHKIAHIDMNISKVIHINDYEYRNKMVFPISINNGHIIIGMYETNSHRIVEIEKCLIANPLINDTLNIFRNYCNKVKDNLDNFKYLVVRTNGKDILVTIVSSVRVDLKDLYEDLKSNFTRCGVSNLVSNSDIEILDGKYYYEYGIEALDFNWKDISYSVNNLGFLQVNDVVKDKLYQLVESIIEQDSNVVDAYCGAGLMTAICAQKAKYVVGLEINKSAIESARRLVKDNKITNVQFIRCDVKDEIAKYLRKYSCVTLILDPPRAGCDLAVLNSILDSNSVKKIIYISCDPATLARDLEVLKAKYQIISVQPLDMFPQTKHVESVCTLERDKDE